MFIVYIFFSSNYACLRLWFPPEHLNKAFVTLGLSMFLRLAAIPHFLQVDHFIAVHDFLFEIAVVIDRNCRPSGRRWRTLFLVAMPHCRLNSLSSRTTNICVVNSLSAQTSLDSGLRRDWTPLHPWDYRRVHWRTIWRNCELLNRRHWSSCRGLKNWRSTMRTFRRQWFSRINTRSILWRFVNDGFKVIVCHVLFSLLNTLALRFVVMTVGISFVIGQAQYAADGVEGTVINTCKMPLCCYMVKSNAVDAREVSLPLLTLWCCQHFYFHILRLGVIGEGSGGKKEREWGNHALPLPLSMPLHLLALWCRQNCISIQWDKVGSGEDRRRVAMISWFLLATLVGNLCCHYHSSYHITIAIAFAIKMTIAVTMAIAIAVITLPLSRYDCQYHRHCLYHLHVTCTILIGLLWCGSFTLLLWSNLSRSFHIFLLKLPVDKSVINGETTSFTAPMCASGLQSAVIAICGCIRILIGWLVSGDSHCFIHFFIHRVTTTDNRWVTS